MRKLNRRLKGFLNNLIRPSQNDKILNHATMAIRIIERGCITEHETSILTNLGYKEA
jgi:hypothetical protein